jgi:hypothetical protein
MSDWPYKSVPVVREDKHPTRSDTVKCRKTIVPPEIEDECNDLSELGIPLPDSADDQ